MNIFVSFLLLSLNVNSPLVNDSSSVDELKIARVLRQAVRQADSTLLKTTLLGNWRDYLKGATKNLSTQLQPLVLIKFDEDMSFRMQLKTIIEWQHHWQQKETEHFIYYYRWDQPLPDLILEIQEIQYKELVKLFNVEPSEKIPFRYDLTATETVVFPYEDLRAGIISPQPFDLEKTALAILYFINSEPPSILEPLAKIYGTYFQNPSTSAAYFEHCLSQIKKHGYTSATELYTYEAIDKLKSADWFSAYVFAYLLAQEFGPDQLAAFLSQINCDLSVDEFQTTFRAVFNINLHEFENSFRHGAVFKM